MAKQSDADILAQLYLDARERLYQTITGDTGVGTKTYANTILKQLDAELKKLKKSSNSFIDTRIPREYKRELDSLYAYFTKHNLLMKSPEVFASLHGDAIYAIAREMQYQLDDALITVGRQVTRYVERAYDESLRQAGLRHAGIKASSGGTVQDMRSALLKDLQENGFMTVQYGEGKNARQVPVDVYAGMVARSTTREAANTARLNQLTSNGYDLVEITEHYPTCNVCAALQGRVYSISGNDPRFPPLSKAFGRYNNIHPNCRHVAVPWVESLRTPGEVAAAVEKSNRPFEDSRSAQEVARYNELQAENRRARETLYQYERYKAVLAGDAPKSVVSFSRMKYNNPDEFEVLSDKYHYMQKHPNSSPRFYDLDQALKKRGIKVGLALKPQRVQAFILEDTGSHDPSHIMKRMLERNLTDDQLRAYIDDAIVMFNQWGGSRKVFYSHSGAAVITKKGDEWIFKTAWGKEDFDEEAITILKEAIKYVGV